SLLCRRRHPWIVREANWLEDEQVPEEGEAGELDLAASPSAICRFVSALQRWPCYVSNIWDDWVFAKLVGHDGEQMFYAFNIQANLSLPFPCLKDGPVEGSAMAIVERKLYLLGGVLRGGVASNCAYVCDPANLWGWRRIASMTVARRNAVAITKPDGCLLVFGGCEDNSAPLGEVFHPSRQRWTPLEVGSNHPARGFKPPFQFVVVKDVAYIRNAARGIVFDNANLGWTVNPMEIALCSRAHQELFLHWCMDCNAVAGGPELDLLITCYVEMRRTRTGRGPERDEAVYSVRAYDPATHSWLPIRGLPRIIQENARRCQFMAFEHKRTQGVSIMLEGGLSIITFDLLYGVPNTVGGEISFMMTRKFLRSRPRPPIKNKWLLQM
ncbi:hypothetical protein KI387_003563, partial [Taxus chinensis]